jgi:hypothetical protein
VTSSQEVGQTSVERCSFCGSASSEDNALVAGGGPEAGGLARVQICADCVAACGEALQVERRLGEARASQRPPPRSSRAPGELGQVRDWTPFTMEGRALEWRAERVLVSERRPRTVVSVRLRGKDQVLSVEFEGSAALAEGHATLVAGLLRQPTRAPAGEAERALLHDWKAFERAGATYEWRAERASVLRARPVLRVSVRDPQGGAPTGMEFDPRIEPSVDEAVMVATASLRDSSELDDVPDALIT